jgi:CHAT domain-containing protein/tetratricopeptide (TPR) repeat protein
MMATRIAAKRRAAILVLAIAFVAVWAPWGSTQTSGDDSFPEAERLLGEALQLYESKQYEQSMEIYSQALALYRELADTAGEVRSLIGQAWCLFRLGDVGNAYLLFEEARATAESARLLEEAGEAYNGIARCFREYGVNLRRLGRLDEAAEYMQAAIDTCAVALERFREAADEEGQGKVLVNLGSCYGVLGDHETAIAYYEDALSFLSECGDRADVLLALGQLYALRLDFQRALDCHSKAGVLYRTVGNLPGEAASAYHVGYCAMRLADYQIALRFSEQALEIYTQLEHLEGKAMSLNNIGMCLRLLSDYEPAIAAFAKSLPLARAISATGGSKRLEADALYGIGLCHMALGDLEEAVERLVEALPAYMQVGPQTGDWVGLANCYGALGDCALRGEERDSAQAIEHYEKSKMYHERNRFAPGIASALLSLGEAHEALGDLPTAAEQFDEALQLGETNQMEERVWRAHWGLGRIAREQQDLEGARRSYEEAIAIVERIRSRIGMERLAQSYFASVQALYEDFLDLLFEMNALDDLLAFAERSRTRQLLDMLAGGGFALVDAAYGATSEGTVDSQEVEALMQEAWQRLAEDEALIVYAWGFDHLFTWIVKSDGIGPATVQTIRQVEVIDRICSFRMLLEGSPIERWLAREELAWLYRLLIAPVAEELADASTWIIVPSGPLWFVPFAALRPSQDDPQVIESHAVAYAPSVASVPSLLDAQDAVSGVGSLGLAALARADESLPTIPTTLAEELSDAVRTATNALAVEASTFLNSASEGAAARLIDGERPRFLIFACHGIFRPDNPPFSYLALMPDGPEGSEDGNLEAREVLSIEGLQGTELAVLMACETFLTSFTTQAGTAGLAAEALEQERHQTAWKLTRGDELVGLSRSFLLAGCAAVLATHWQVYVPAAAGLLPLLGEELAAGRSKAAALQRAQLRLMELPEFAQDPWKWSPFVLIGNWR